MRISTMLIGLVVACLSSVGLADERPLFGGGGNYNAKLLDVEEFSLDLMKYEVNRDPYFPNHGQEDWVATKNINYRLSLLGCFYFDNRFHIGMDNTPQIREGGWEYTIGLRIFSWLDAVRFHHSRHSMDASQPGPRFPVADAYGVKIRLID